VPPAVPKAPQKIYKQATAKAGMAEYDSASVTPNTILHLSENWEWALIKTVTPLQKRENQCPIY
jgi:hypothetical protein